MFQLGRVFYLPTRNLKKINARWLAAAASTNKSKPLKESQSFMMNLFRGHLQTSQVFPYPEVLKEDERETLSMLIDPCEKFFKEVNDATKNDEIEKVSPESLKALWELGLFGLQVPEDLGGLGLTNTQYARLVEIVGKYDLAVGITLGSHQSIGFKGILLFGTPEQKAKYLPRVTSGREFAAFCLTEPSSGSDAGSIRSRAVLSPDGKYWILNGSKIWISNGGIADIMTVFAQTPVTDPKTGKEVDKVTAFIVERSFGGVTSGPPEKKMGIKASNTTDVYYEDVKIPVENVIGEVGAGFKVAMNILNNGRFGMSACMAGTMRRAAEKAIEHVTTRVQFGHKLEEYGGIQEKLARMQMLHYVDESIAYMLSGNMDNGSVDYHLEAAISKVFASEAAWYIADESIQILGGMGFMRATELERFVRDLRIFRIFEGTNDILRLFVALTGIQFAGSHLRELQKAFKNPTANLSLIMGEATKRAIRSVGLSSSPTLSPFVDSSLAKSANQASKCVESFGQAVEGVLVKYGKGIVEQQFILNRLAQSAIDIYTMVVVLSRVTRSIEKQLPSAAHEKLMVEIWCSEANQRIITSLSSIRNPETLDNFVKMSNISKELCKKGTFVQEHPLNL